MTDRSIDWLRSISALAPDKPFFLYYAPGATHAPHHVAPEWSARYRGAFDMGWDVIRERTLARQIELGVVPKGTKLAPRPDDIRAWDTLSPDEKRLFARQMEVFAGFAEMADHEAGRLIDTLKEMGRFDNTLIFYVHLQSLRIRLGTRGLHPVQLAQTGRLRFRGNAQRARGVVAGASR